MMTIRVERAADGGAREDILDQAWGAARWQKTAERLREGRLPAVGLSFVAASDRKIVGTVRMWDICAGSGRPAGTATAPEAAPAAGPATTTGQHLPLSHR